MTLEEIAHERWWFRSNVLHLVDYDSRMLYAEAERALILLADVAQGREIRDPPAQHAATVQQARAEFERRIARRPPPTITPQALQEGWFVPLDQQRALGVPVYRRVSMPRVRNRFDPITGKKD